MTLSLRGNPAMQLSLLWISAPEPLQMTADITEPLWPSNVMVHSLVSVHQTLAVQVTQCGGNEAAIGVDAPRPHAVFLAVEHNGALASVGAPDLAGAILSRGENDATIGIEDRQPQVVF